MKLWDEETLVWDFCFYLGNGFLDDVRPFGSDL